MLVRRNRLKISWFPREPDIAEATLHKTVAGPVKSCCSLYSH
jgi:hypothetical protein